MNRNVRARIFCAKDVLQRVQGTDSHETVSSTQKLALADLVRREKACDRISVHEAADLSILVSHLPWHSSKDGTAVQHELITKDRNPRRNQQDFKAMTNYFTRRRWNFLSSNLSYDIISTALKDDAVRLGLRNPLEPTSKFLTSLALVLSHSKDLSKISHAGKIVYFKTFKQDFKRMARDAPHPRVYLDKLPADPAELKAADLELWVNVYGEEEPVSVCQHLLQDVLSFDTTYRCRGGVGAEFTRHGPLQMNAASTESSLTASSSTSSMERVATALIDGMGALAEQQRQIMGMFMSGQQSSFSNLSFNAGRNQRRPMIDQGLSPPEVDSKAQLKLKDAASPNLSLGTMSSSIVAFKPEEV